MLTQHIEQSGWNTELAVGYASSNVESLQLLETTGASLTINTAQQVPAVDTNEARFNTLNSEISKFECLEPSDDLKKVSIFVIHGTIGSFDTVLQTFVQFRGKPVPIDNFVPCHSRLILTEWITILVMFTGKSTKVSKY